MPIRINLLAEQQAAEEARRRDPVKRAIYVAIALVALMVLWAVLLQIRLVSAKAELSRYEAKLLTVEENSKEVRTRWGSSSQFEDRMSHLRRYSTNRFFCATALDALQHLVVDDVRVIQLQTSHTYSTNAEATFKTNFVFTLESPSAWQFWKSRQPQPNILSLVSNQIGQITNKVESLKSAVPLNVKIELATNADQVTANVELVKPCTAVEQITLTIKARDYSNPPGRRVDEFSKAIATSPYFSQQLRPGEGEGIRLRERGIQADVDSLDPVSPLKPFIPFIIECRYRPTIRVNE